MDVLQSASSMLEKYPLCNHCLGRQFALLGHGFENDERGSAIKLVLIMRAHMQSLSKGRGGLKALRILTTNGLSDAARQILDMKKRSLTLDNPKACFLCEDRFKACDNMVQGALKQLADYEYSNFLVGTELPTKVAEREDEFKAEFEVTYGENLRNEFGRVIGKRIASHTGKVVEFKKPEIVVLINPFTSAIKLQVNPLFVTGRYRKLKRGLPQSKWLCSDCRGKGCKKCNWTGKMYSESVQEIIEKPLLEATSGMNMSFHASGREDIDARMLGNGRPFVAEVTRPKKRFIDLKKLEEAVNSYGKRKIEVSGLKPANKDVVRELKKGESTQKEYRVLIDFENKIETRDVRLLEDSLRNTMIKQETPLRVLHRRANLMREKYIYEVNVKKLSPKKAEMKIRCQGGLYVKELVTGDEGRTVPSISTILGNKAKPMKLDVLNVIMET